LRWDAVYGQTAAVWALQGALRRGRVGHAYLFVGPPGVGRRLTASVFAAGLQCTASDGAGRPCGQCDECDATARRVHPDVFRLEPVDDKILIDQVRTLQQRASLKAVRGRYKVFIVEGIGAATEQAQNALLKVLEEPAGDAVFILVADEGRRPLPTIVSRCLTIRFGPLRRDDAVRVLEEKFDYGSAAPLAAALGDGSVERARHSGPDELLEQRRKALALLRELLGRPPSAAAVQTELWYKERDELVPLLDFMELYLRDVLLLQQVPEAAKDGEAWLVNFDLLDGLSKDARRLPLGDVVGALEALLAFRRRLGQNVGIRSALAVLFLELARTGRAAAS